MDLLPQELRDLDENTKRDRKGATTVSIMTSGIATLSIMTFGTVIKSKISSIMTVSIRIKIRHSA